MAIFDFYRKKKKLSIEEGANVLSAKIIQIAAFCAEKLKDTRAAQEGRRGPDGVTSLEVMFHFQYFFLHLTSRVALIKFGPEKRAKFMDSLSGAIIDENSRILSQTIGKGVKNFGKKYKTYFLECLTKTGNEYSRYKITEGKEIGLKDTLYWEFGKKIAKLLDPDDLLINTIAAGDLAMGRGKDLELVEIIEKIK